LDKILKIVVVGSSNTDMIIKVPRIPNPGETVLGGKYSTAAGGKGANQAVAAARAGGRVTFVACVGNDVLGSQAIAGFKSDGIDVDYIKTDKTGPSGVALIFVEEQGENSIAVASGANAKLSPQDVDSVSDVIKNADILLMQLETPLETVFRAAEIATSAGVKVILNPAPACPLGDALFRNLTIITPNQSEASLLTGIKVKDMPSAEKAANVLLDRGLETVIVTLGKSGAFLKTHNQALTVPGFSVNAVDATAAGDVFNGALAVALANGKILENSVRFANAAAALSVTKLGAQPSAPFRKDILALENSGFKEGKI
jgi:ribokinase